MKDTIEELEPFGDGYYHEMKFVMLSVLWLILLIPILIFENIYLAILMGIGLLSQLVYVGIHNFVREQKYEKLKVIKH